MVLIKKMSKLLKNIFLKNKICFHNIIEVQAYKKSNNLIPVSNYYELNFLYRTQPFATREYAISCSCIYRQYDKVSSSTHKKIQYADLNYFINDIKFLNDWNIIVQSNPKEMVTNETINNNIINYGHNLLC
jgi:hypothetical protein